ncbi:gamma-mobile-trio protein GmtX [Massilia sp. 2TAF26]|uniref:gamma-mobile-trio protein GmtX n=1 Tax=Massilia sp. 2TAF26 TaxID=3233012 RepID=UPI003F9E750E
MRRRQSCQTSGGRANSDLTALVEDYRTLIKAWDQFSGPVKPRTHEAKLKASHEFIARIDDPAIRALEHKALIDHDRLRAEVDLLKSLTRYIKGVARHGFRHGSGDHSCRCTFCVLTARQSESLRCL